jgi:hypothetical protein
MARQSGQDRRMRAAVLLCLLATSAAGQSFPFAVTLPDDATLAAVGRLGPLKLGAPGCSAVLIAPERIATAGHCIGPKSNAGRFRTVFAAGLGRDDAPPIVAGEQPLLRDVAVADLRRGPDGVAPLAVAVPPEVGAVVAIAGYRNDEMDRRLHVASCRVSGRADRAIRLDCPAVSGMSGGPVLVRDGDGWAVGGIVVARVGTAASIAVTFDPAEFADPAD